MCFSATASLAVSSGAAAAGAISCMRAESWRQMPLAAIPLVFALQQAIEGVLWIELGHGGMPATISALANAFAGFALIAWPALSPIAAGLVEPDARRRMAIGVLFAIAVPLSVYGAWNIAYHPYGVCVASHALSYRNNSLYPAPAMAAYAACTCLPFLLSSHGALRRFGIVVTAGLAISIVFFFVALVSVWCFFAAAASALILLEFSRVPGGPAPGTVRWGLRPGSYHRTE